ncbi:MULTISPECIES: hypothetical protein [Methylobacterium]|uniref:Uncharacterized protein n=1 Tax=Methylobacterium thuringiense TaxID=1003091 RepID=A0ABQ4TSL8_9HYPH|nr:MULTISPECIES: hypothetical protein [Methylobacterium]TXN20083.1 hypothetical protein FV217_19225 [Methylobacterium sp. WL9]GJE57157.1 hypothetical protein EKPJFOCH_3669 [Methylobacterium thuringiense]
MSKRMSHGIMSSKTIPAVVGALSILLAASPAFAQSMFEQMPVAPGDAPPGAAAEPSAVAAPSMSMGMGAPSAPMGVPSAKSVGPQAGVDCNAIQKTLNDRKNLVAKANAASQSKQKMTPAAACALFGQLHANGVTGIKWIATNKEWCSIPDSFAQGFKTDNDKVGGIRSKVCGMAAQVTKMEAQARAGGGGEGGGGGGLLGGPGLQGSFKMPQGAL